MENTLKFKCNSVLCVISQICPENNRELAMASQTLRKGRPWNVDTLGPQLVQLQKIKDPIIFITFDPSKNFLNFLNNWLSHGGLSFTRTLNMGFYTFFGQKTWQLDNLRYIRGLKHAARGAACAARKHLKECQEYNVWSNLADFEVFSCILRPAKAFFL